MQTFDINSLKFDAQGLIPAIVQDAFTNKVLMLAYMNKESLQISLDTGFTCFYSRSRQELWQKGATSSNVQEIQSISYDCDKDTLLVMVKQTGVSCHTGSYSCFFNDPIYSKQLQNKLPVQAEQNLPQVLRDLYAVIVDRREHGDEKSYTKYLFVKGQDKILKKVGEEAAETIIASKNENSQEVIYEMSDLWYHCLVLLAYHNITPEQLLNELASRRK